MGKHWGIQRGCMYADTTVKTFDLPLSKTLVALIIPNEKLYTYIDIYAYNLQRDFDTAVGITHNLFFIAW